MLNRYRPHALLLFALIGASGCSDRSAPQPQRNTTRVETNNDVLPAHVVQVLPYRMEAPGDGPVQVVLFGDGFEFVSQLVLGKAGSSTPIAGDPITVAPATGPSQIAPIRQLTVVLTRDQIANADWVAVVDKDGQQGKPFYFREVSERHPDLVRINSTVIAVDTGEPLVVLGHHHFDHTSTLLVDDQPLDAAQFTVERGDNGAFRLTIADPASLGLGAHRLRLENAPRDPLAAVAQSLPFVPFASTELAFEVVETSTAELALTGADLTVTLDGATGALRRIDQLSSGRSYHLDTQHPWRLRVRQLAQDTTRSHSNSPLVKQLVDPVTAGCRQSLTAVPLPLTNGQGLRLHWSGCKLDHHAPETNRFEVTQELTLTASDELRIATSIGSDPNAPVVDFGLNEIKTYLSLSDSAVSAQSPLSRTPQPGVYGTIVDRGVESVIDPMWTLPSIGGRSSCNTVAAVPEIRCDDPDHGTPETYLDHDGDGVGWYSAFNLGGALYADDGSYIMLYAPDPLHPASFVHLGDLGEFRVTAAEQVQNSYFAASFTHSSPMPFVVKLGQGQRYTGKESWINVADELSAGYRSKGWLQTPIDLRPDVPARLKNLAAHSVFGGTSEMLSPEGTPKMVAPQWLASLARGREQLGLGLDDSFLFMWGGLIDATNSVLWLHKHPQADMVTGFLKDNGLASCHYSLYGVMGVNDPARDPSEEGWYDPAGSVSGDDQGVFMHPRGDHHLQWRSARFADINNNGNGAKCVYLDGIRAAELYNPNIVSEGPIKDLHHFLKTYNNDMRAVDAESFTLHEAFLAANVLTGHIAAMGNSPTLPVQLYAAVDTNDLLFAPYVARMFEGYFVPLVSNGFSTLQFTNMPRYLNSERYHEVDLPAGYDITPTEALEAENALGAIYDGSAPFYGELFARQATGYKTLAEAENIDDPRHLYPPSILQAYAHMGSRTLPELVYLRQKCREAFNGKWHPPAMTDVPVEEVYLVSKPARYTTKEGYHRAQIPALINSVRQLHSPQGQWTDHFAILLYNWHMEDNDTFNLYFDFDRYGLTKGKLYTLNIHTTQGSVALGERSDSFVLTLPVSKSRAGCIDIQPSL